MFGREPPGLLFGFRDLGFRGLGVQGFKGSGFRGWYGLVQAASAFALGGLVGLGSLILGHGWLKQCLVSWWGKAGMDEFRLQAFRVSVVPGGEFNDTRGWKEEGSGTQEKSGRLDICRHPLSRLGTCDLFSVTDFSRTPTP